MKNIYEKDGGTYYWEGDYLIPDLEAPDENVGIIDLLHLRLIGASKIMNPGSCSKLSFNLEGKHLFRFCLNDWRNLLI